MTGMSAESSGRWQSLLSDFAGDRLVGTMVTGVVLAMVNSLLSIALMSLIFQGDLARMLPIGVGLGLVGSGVVAAVVGVGSGLPGMYAGIQDASAAILGLAAGSVAASVTGATTVHTVIAMIVVTSVATGLVLLAMGRFRLGEVARFVPFPVIGGLLAGTGYLIVAGSVEILGGLSRDALMGSEGAGLLWPGLVLAGFFLVASRRGWPSRWYLTFLALGIGAFHVALVAAGIGRQVALERGWLLGPFPTGSLWPGLAIRSLSQADWGAVAGEAVSLVTILLIVPMTVLLYVSALEVETRHDLDMGIELRVTGWANVAAGLAGGPPGYLYLADTVVTRRLVGERRGPAVVAAAGMALLVAAGSAVLGFLPQFVIGGMLLFVGVDFLVEWLWDSRRRMAPLDYLLMLGIVAIIATIGFLPGVAAGLISAIVLFVFRYSQIDVVKHSLTGSEHRSNIERPPVQTEYLEREGGSVVILQLQGFIFFGTANRVISQVRARLEEPGRVKFVVCDFRLVTGVDSSAVLIFERMALLAEENGFVLVLTGLSPTQVGQLDLLISRFAGSVRVEPDLDRGVAWCEDRLLEEGGAAPDGLRALPDGLVERLEPYLESRIIPPRTRLMSQGDPTSGLYLIISGRATVLLEGPDGREVRLRTVLEGTLLGEISLYRDEPVTATVVTDTECRLLHLTPKAFNGLCQADPTVAADLHAFVARTLAARVSHANRAIQALYR